MFYHIYWLFFLTFVFSFCLDLFFVPTWLEFFWPEWTALVALFWALSAPSYFGVLGAWVVGLLADALHAQPLGQQALSLAVMVYFANMVHLRMRAFHLWQQCVTVFVLMGLNQMVYRTIGGVFDVVTESWWYYLPAFVGACLWPLIVPFFLTIRRHWHAAEGMRGF